MKSSPVVFSIAVLIASFSHLAAANASTPLVICGANDPAGTTEVDQVTNARGSGEINQLVIRNRNILNDFIEKGALKQNAINSRGEYIIQGFNTPQGIVDGQGMVFKAENGGYTLSAFQDNFGTRPASLLARFHFNDCVTYGQ